MAGHENTCTSCACNVCSKIRFTINQIFSVLDIYGWILDAYVVDFFQENLWKKLPNSWKTIIDEVEPEELGKWILGELGSKNVWPLSLLALRSFIRNAEICRNYEDQSILKCSKVVDQKNVEWRRHERKLVSVQDERFNNLFIKHVKEKKRYEIDVISKIAAKCAKDAECECIVDIGSGMGHLARVLAYKYDLCVTCIEQNPTLLEGARKWDEQLSMSLTKHIPNFRERKPNHVSIQVEASNVARKQLANQLTEIFEKNFDVPESRIGFGLIGLHPCGDLAATLLRFYTNEQQARFICIVGCCYMKLTLKTESEIGYPLSQNFKSIKSNYRLSYAALEVACHAVEKHCDKLKMNNYNDLIVHAYRAVLECLLMEKNSSLKHTQLRNTKIPENGMSFEEYCNLATRDLGLHYRPTSSDFERTDVRNYLYRWKRVLVFGSLRLLLASLVETLVLFDRFLYLSELNLSPSLKAQFDSRVSPRNILLTSIKR